jgi:hypothetical protein
LSLARQSEALTRPSARRKTITALDTALHEPVTVTTLRELVLVELKHRDRDAVHQKLEQLHQSLRGANRERDDNAVFEIMDQLTGWCSPHLRL